MITSHLFRTWRRSRFYALVMVLGLTGGLTCASLAVVVIEDYVTADAFYSDQGDTFTLSGTYDTAQGSITVTSFGEEVAVAASGLEGVAAVSVLRGTGRGLLVDAGKVPIREREPTPLMFLGQDALDILPFAISEGDKVAPLDGPGNIMISTDRARRLFGEDSPIGERLTLNGSGLVRDFIVSAVFDDLPLNTSWRPHYLVSWGAQVDEGGGLGVVVVKVHPGTDLGRLSSRLGEVANRLPSLQRRAEEGTAVRARMHLREFGDIDLGQNRREIFAYVFTAISLLVLFIGCVNYSSLAIAQSLARLAEVGVRRAVGATRWGVAREFLIESILMCVLSLCISIPIAEMLRPSLGTMLQTDLSSDWMFEWRVVGALCLVSVALGIVSGLAPAIHLTRYQLAQALASRKSSKSGRGRAQQAFAFVQFVVASVLVLLVLGLQGQLGVVQSSTMGIQPTNVVAIPLEGYSTTTVSGHSVVYEGPPGMEVLTQKQPIFERRYFPPGISLATVKSSFLELPQVESVAVTSFLPGMRRAPTNPVFALASDSSTVRLESFEADPAILEVLGLQLRSGRAILPDDRGPPRTNLGPDDRVLVNQSAASLLGSAEADIRRLHMKEPSRAGRPGRWVPGPEVVGVISDFQIQSLHSRVPGIIVRTMDLRTETPQGEDAHLLVRLRGSDVATGIQRLQEEWESAVPGQPFTYTFLSDAIAAEYSVEMRILDATSWVCVFALGVACMGLVGIATSSLRTRRREFAIRRAIGATRERMAVLLLTGILGPVLGASIVSWPIAGAALESWLSDFEYRVHLDAIFFLTGSAIVVSTALLAIGWQSAQALRVMPADGLRSD